MIEGLAGFFLSQWSYSIPTAAFFWHSGKICIKTTQVAKNLRPSRNSFDTLQKESFYSSDLLNYLVGKIKPNTLIIILSFIWPSVNCQFKQWNAFSNMLAHFKTQTHPIYITKPTSVVSNTPPLKFTLPRKIKTDNVKVNKFLSLYLLHTCKSLNSGIRRGKDRLRWLQSHFLLPVTVTTRASSTAMIQTVGRKLLLE